MTLADVLPEKPIVIPACRLKEYGLNTAYGAEPPSLKGRKTSDVRTVGLPARNNIRGNGQHCEGKSPEVTAKGQLERDAGW